MVAEWLLWRACETGMNCKWFFKRWAVNRGAVLRVYAVQRVFKSCWKSPWITTNLIWGDNSSPLQKTVISSTLEISKILVLNKFFILCIFSTIRPHSHTKAVLIILRGWIKHEDGPQNPRRVLPPPQYTANCPPCLLSCPTLPETCSSPGDQWQSIPSASKKGEGASLPTCLFRQSCGDCFVPAVLARWVQEYVELD